MRFFSLPAALGILLGLTCLASCRIRPKDTPWQESSFVVNGREGDTQLTPSADIQTLRFSLYCELDEWTVREEGTPADWALLSRQKSRIEHYWDISVQLTENTTSSPRKAVFIFSCEDKERRVSIVQSVEDPIFRIQTVGAYGVPGGDVVYDPDHFQTARLYFGDKMSFRWMDLSGARVASLSGFPRALEPGMLFTVRYSVVENGFTRAGTSFPVQVIRVREPLVWIKKDESTYFIIRP